MYAMQDYISQYQQLVRRYRSENSALRCQLAQERGGTIVEREPEPMPRSQPNLPNTKNGPKMEVPRTPGTDRRQGPSPDLEIPEVPPLKSTKSENVDRGKGALALQIKRPGKSQVVPASYDGQREMKNLPDVLLTGEVVENIAGGGPRLVVDIAPFDRTGRFSKFDGNVSVVLVACLADGRHKNLARWDFGPEQVRSAVDATASEPTMRFHIELPTGAKTGDPTELWVRLAPAEGGKMLSHAKIDLSRVGVFSSRTDKLWPTEESVVAANYTESAPRSTDVAPAESEGSWAIARPGKPANLPQGPDEAGGGWKATNTAIPAAVASRPSAASKPTSRKPDEASKPAGDRTAEVAQKPTWSPERAGSSAQVVRPTWSATR